MVVLGMAGDMVGSSDAPSMTYWRVGGMPVVPKALCAKRLDVKCPECSETMALVVQVWPFPSPIRADGGYQTIGYATSMLGLVLQVSGAIPEAVPSSDRQLCLFGCMRDGCGKEAGSWRAVSFWTPASTSGKDSRLSEVAPVHNAVMQDTASQGRNNMEQLATASSSGAQGNGEYKWDLGDEGSCPPTSRVDTWGTGASDWGLDDAADSSKPSGASRGRAGSTSYVSLQRDVAEGDVWDVGDSGWGNDQAGCVGPSTCSMDDLAAELGTVLNISHPAPSTRATVKQEAQGDSGTSLYMPEAAYADWSGPKLPEFYLWRQEEPDLDLAQVLKLYL